MNYKQQLFVARSGLLNVPHETLKLQAQSLNVELLAFMVRFHVSNLFPPLDCYQLLRDCINERKKKKEGFKKVITTDAIEELIEHA